MVNEVLYESYLVLDKVEFLLDGGFREVECIFEVIVAVDRIIVFFDVGFLTTGIEFLEMSEDLLNWCEALFDMSNLM